MVDTNFKLRAWMGAHRVSGVELAKMIDMSYETFKRKMSGDSQWKLSEVEALLRVTESTFDELF